jgi:hypothetical protein
LTFDFDKEKVQILDDKKVPKFTCSNSQIIKYLSLVSLLPPDSLSRFRRGHWPNVRSFLSGMSSTLENRFLSASWSQFYETVSAEIYS